MDPMERLVAYYDGLDGHVAPVRPFVRARRNPSRPAPTPPTPVAAEMVRLAASVYVVTPDGTRTLVERRCNCCHVFKPVAQMARHAQCADGISYRCRACHNTASAEGRQGKATLTERLEALVDRLEGLTA